VNFLGVGYQEIVLVMVLMLIFVGPERMPQVAYQIGRAVRTMQKYARAVRDEFSEEIGYIEEQVKTVRGEVETTRASLRDQQASFQADLTQIAPAPLSELMGTSGMSLSNSLSIDGAMPEASTSSDSNPPATSEGDTQPAPETPRTPGPTLVF